MFGVSIDDFISIDRFNKSYIDIVGGVVIGLVSESVWVYAGYVYGFIE